MVPQQFLVHLEPETLRHGTTISKIIGAFVFVLSRRRSSRTSQGSWQRAARPREQGGGREGPPLLRLVHGGCRFQGGAGRPSTAQRDGDDAEELSSRSFQRHVGLQRGAVLVPRALRGALKGTPTGSR